MSTAMTYRFQLSRLGDGVVQYRGDGMDEVRGYWLDSKDEVQEMLHDVNMRISELEQALAFAERLLGAHRSSEGPRWQDRLGGGSGYDDGLYGVSPR